MNTQTNEEVVEEVEVWDLIELDDRQLPQLLTWLKEKALELKSLFT